ncbi:MAG: divisome protein SepX/GlpR [Aeromicrobium sp.]
MGTGLIVAFVVAIWAAYFVPLVLRRYDEASTSSSLEDLSPLSRVINRPTTDSEEVDAPEPTPAVDEPAPQVTRSSARLAARRRRRTLLTLLAATAIVGGLVGFRVIPIWSIAIPVGLVLAWLVACRVQVRHERGVSTKRVKKSKRSKRSTKATSASSADDDESTVIVSGQVEDVNPGRRHIMESIPLESDALDEQLVIAAPSVATTGDLVWDPLPVTVPTYVTKPRAGRTVRTIDFAQPGAWTSGHVEGEDVELPSREPASDDAQRRAANQ